MSVDLVLHLHRTGDGKVLAFDLSTQEARNAVWDLVERAKPKHNDYLRVILGPPVKPIKTGPRGQLKRHWGHCGDIAEQLDTEENRVTKEMVDDFLRREAVKEGFPCFFNVLTEKVEPEHFDGRLSVENANIVELVKRRFVDKIPLWITEYIDTEHPEKGSYKSIQGRSYEEMAGYWVEQAKRTYQG